MGREARCTLTHGRTKADGKALLETDALIFRGGDVRLSVPYSQMSSVEAKNGALRVKFPNGLAVFEIGAEAPTWAEKIRNPPSRLDKLGVKPEHSVIVAGLKDDEFTQELVDRAARVSTRLAPRRGSGQAGLADIIFYAASSRAALAKLVTLQKNLARNGAIWVIRPKGVSAITERDVMDAGKAAGLVDVKVARFSDTHTAEKLVIPVARR